MLRRKKRAAVTLALKVMRNKERYCRRFLVSKTLSCRRKRKSLRKRRRRKSMRKRRYLTCLN